MRQGRLLLGRRSPHRRAYPNRWDAIGGKVEPGETTAQALARELSEELGIVPTAVQPLASLDDADARGQGVATYHFFTVTEWHGDPTIRDDEHSELRWFTLAEACALPDLAVPDYVPLFRRIGLPP